ncbi:O-antigen/teichoic acid export membrane protein [Deinococcus sp. HSC-46F16]|uniref:lipopolysaccharide biosynthesis protein n=1 Tax=Deinococcus sp. HSC-46F16 TaxID=2910968 RepID=UPI00209DD7EE|nr:oligosaccharide flippase family protein [Deinococcus sp. HSC-46F16]MCP2014425.1 O-antigen/teichoic acid export membrane protein [Deinococcus sp. HSC-46F16]
MPTSPSPPPRLAPPPATPRPVGLRAGVVWTVLGQGTSAAAQWAVVALLARLGNPEAVGQYALGLGLVNPLYLLLGLQLRSVQATDAGEARPFGQYFSLRALTMLLALAITAGLAALYPRAAGVILWLGAAKALEGLSDVTYGLMQRHERLDWVSRSTMLRGVLGLGLLAALFAATGSVTLGAAGVALAGLAVLLVHDLPLARRLAPGGWWTRHIPAGLPRLALPLGVVMGLVSLGSTLPRLFLEHAHGSAAVGVYSALSYVTAAGSIVVVALGTALTTRLSHLFATGQRAGFVRLTLGLVGAAAAFGGGLTLLAAVAGGPLLGLLYGPDYAAEGRAFLWLTLGGALSYLASCAGFAVTAARRFREQLPLFAAVTVLLALACAWLIPPYGVMGAAFAGLIGAGAQLAGSGLIVAGALRAGPAPVSGDP